MSPCPSTSPRAAAQYRHTDDPLDMLEHLSPPTGSVHRGRGAGLSLASTAREYYTT